ncbi:hypothetical protein LINPERPRIM_LOCUS17585 [Linum perenne]
MLLLEGNHTATYSSLPFHLVSYMELLSVSLPLFLKEITLLPLHFTTMLTTLVQMLPDLSCLQPPSIIQKDQNSLTN